MSRSRATAMFVLTAVLGLSGCGFDVPEPGSTGTSGAETGTGEEVPEDVAAWADAVCSRGVEVRQALTGISEGLDVDVLQGAGALEQARGLIESRISDAQGAVEDLRSEIAAAPDHPVAQEARASLEEPFATLDQSQRAAVQETEAALDATSVPEALTAAGRALTAVRSTTQSAGDLVEPLTGQSPDVSPEASAAFTQAPACEALTNQ